MNLGESILNEHRKIRRHSTMASIGYQTGGQSAPGQMTDLSANGCRAILAGAVPDEGEALLVTLLEGVEVPGCIAWRDGAIVGIRFDRPVIDAVVRYFGLPDYVATVRDVTTDAFGRVLPPLAGGSR